MLLGQARKWLSRFAVIAFAATVASSAFVLSASAQQTHHVYGTGSAGVRLRTAPNTSSSTIRVMAEGTTVFIECQLRAQYVTAPNGVRSAVWNKISGGYSSDLFFDTEAVDAYSPGIPVCGATPPPPPPATDGQRAVDKARTMIGSTAYEGWCDKWVAVDYGFSRSGEQSAYAHYRHLSSLGRIGHGTAPLGALLFFGPTNSNRNYGHVAIWDGSRVISTSVHSHVDYTTIDWLNRYSGPYLGWASGSRTYLFPNGG